MMPRILVSGCSLSRSSFLCLTLVAAPLLSTHLQAQQPGPELGYGYGSQNPPGSAGPQYPPAQPFSQPQYAPPQPYTAPAPSYEQQPAPEQAYGPPEQPYADDPGPPQTSQAPVSPDRLEQLVAPIALYPDTLLAQILTASTYPAQVAVAHQWLQQMQSQGYNSPDQIAAGADSQDWDPSVKALTAVPQVLEMLDGNLQWTTELGNAYYNQPQDVMQTVQVLRQRAEQAGNLESTPQENVTEDQGAILLAPPSPDVVYVPSYDPWSIYGAPIAPYPYFSFADAFGSFVFDSGMRFGVGIAVDAFEPWGWMGWGCDWFGHRVLFRRAGYFTYSRSVRDWGFPHGGTRAYRGWDHGGRWDRGYGHGRGGQYARGGWERGGEHGYDHGSGYGRGNGNNRGGYGNGYGHGGSGQYASAGRPEYQRGMNFGRGNGFASGRAYGGAGINRGYGNFNRGAASPGFSYGRGAQQADDGSTSRFSHSQNYGGNYGRYGYGYTGRSGQSDITPGRSYSTMPGRSYGGAYGYGGSQRGYSQPPVRSYPQPGRSSGGFRGFERGGNSYGGSHSYSGGHSSFGGNFSGGGHSSFGGGHSSGGGHFGGGGHSGGGNFGGGHSGGGHSGGGGGHHR